MDACFQKGGVFLKDRCYEKQVLVFLFLMLGIELGALHLLDRYSTP
jgi:hypothetical protein